MALRPGDLWALGVISVGALLGLVVSRSVPLWKSPFAAAITSVVAFHLLRLGVPALLKRLRNEALEDRAAELSRLAERIAIAQTLEQLGATLETVIATHVKAELLCFIVAPNDEAPASDSRFTVVRAREAIEVPAPSDAMWTYFEFNPEILLYEDLRPDALAAADAAALFRKHGAEVLVPLVDRSMGSRLRGVITVGPRKDDCPFDDAALAVLQRIKTLATAAIVGSHLYDGLRAVSAELEVKVALRTAELEDAVEKLKGTQRQLLHTEKMTSLGLLVSGVSAGLVAAVDATHANVPRLAEHVGAYRDRLEVLATTALPPEALALERGLRLDFVLSDLPDLLQSISDGAHRARTVARDLARFSHEDDQSREDIDIHACIESTLNLLKHEWKDRITLERRFGLDIPPIQAFRGPLGQVFLNLLLNAGQAISGKGTVTIETALTRDGSFVDIHIRDTGHGIPENIRDRVFEPFFTTKAMNSTQGGSGLGLAITYGIIERHGGRIGFESEAGKGTEFHVSLPVEPTSTRRTWSPQPTLGRTAENRP